MFKNHKKKKKNWKVKPQNQMIVDFAQSFFLQNKDQYSLTLNSTM